MFRRSFLVHIHSIPLMMLSDVAYPKPTGYGPVSTAIESLGFVVTEAQLAFAQVAKWKSFIDNTIMKLGLTPLTSVDPAGTARFPTLGIFILVVSLSVNKIYPTHLIIIV